MLALLMLLPAVTPAATLDHAYWAPDRGTPYKWFEGAPGIQTFFEKDYKAAGYIYAYVRNEGAQEVTATAFTLDGKPLDDLRKANEVVWWRLLPAKLAPGAMGEVMVRPRNPLTAPCELAVTFSDGSEVKTRVAPEPNPIRIETVGFAQERDKVFLAVENLDGKVRRVTGLALDGKDVSADCVFLAPEFVGSTSPISLHLASPLALDSTHTYSVRCDDGSVASCCLHTTDGWVPLGSYGYGDYAEYARVGCNGHNCFGRVGMADLDAHAALGMRQVSMLGGGEVNDFEVGHPGLFAMCLQDEPDCADYGIQDLPHPLRIGQHAMEMERRAQLIRDHNPAKPSMLTVDLTYKPANYYIYGPIADITNPDCYPMVISADATMVREAVETCRLGTGPRQMSFTFQGHLEGVRDPEKFEQLRFPRQAFPAEQRIMMLYAIGAGARGLFNYIHCTENNETRWSRGTGEFPELWNEIGQVYRELDHVSPLLALAHPTKLATSDKEKLWLRTLLCGEDAALVVWVNDDYEQQRLSVPAKPQTDVTLRVPELPWLAGWTAYSVSEDGFAGLESDGGEIRVPRMDVGGVILLTAKDGLTGELQADYRQRKQHIADALLDQWRDDLKAKARRTTERRVIVGENAGGLVAGAAIGAYGMTLGEYWNPTAAQYNVFECGVNDNQEGPEMGAEWAFEVTPEQAGRPQVFVALLGMWGGEGRLEIRDAEGKAVAEGKVGGPWSVGETNRLSFVPPAAGQYKARFTLAGKGPKGARAAVAGYVVGGP